MTGQPLGSSRNKVLKMSLKKLGWYLQARSQSGLKFTSRICGCITRFPDGIEAQPISLRGGGVLGAAGLLRGAAWPEACSCRGKTGAASSPGSATSHHTPLRCLVQWDARPPLLARRAPFLMIPLLSPWCSALHLKVGCGPSRWASSDPDLQVNQRQGAWGSTDQAEATAPPLCPWGAGVAAGGSALGKWGRGGGAPSPSGRLSHFSMRSTAYTARDEG